MAVRRDKIYSGGISSQWTVVRNQKIDIRKQKPYFLLAVIFERWVYLKSETAAQILRSYSYAYLQYQSFDFSHRSRMTGKVYLPYRYYLPAVILERNGA